MRTAGNHAGNPARKKAKVSAAGLITGAAAGAAAAADLSSGLSSARSSVEDPEADEPGTAAPAPAPAAAIVVGENVTAGGSKYWIFTSMRDVPVGVLNKQVASCYIEFLMVDGGEVAEGEKPPKFNHSIMRLNYIHPQAQDKAHAPAGTRGVVIDWAIHNGTDGTTVPSHVQIKNFSYAPPHSRASYEQAIPVMIGRGRSYRHKTVGDFLRVLAQSSILPCAFTNYENGTAAVGCRDIMSQWLCHLNTANVVKIAIGGETLDYDFFNYIHIKDDATIIYPKEVNRAQFTEDYVRVPIPEMDYTADDIIVYNPLTFVPDHDWDDQYDAMVPALPEE
ncbi:uncharacterized protein N7483_009455 [Penicillium malachiteum]|uniref:uncharacterized protein n=1 Tax=Penicillium malachiteum TaxID=1324776 RepID=UPI0025488F53|nr:uncharacterized protein N7483_009455 [Penicillium malachiteum]KAJ5721521.1 hypothetical protein N7483_009455 [Penicillium malachiteum]